MRSLIAKKERLETAIKKNNDMCNKNIWYTTIHNCGIKLK